MRTAKRKRSTYCCALCGRQLPTDRWIYSRFTGSRYCWPGECRKYRRNRATNLNGGQS